MGILAIVGAGGVLGSELVEQALSRAASDEPIMAFTHGAPAPPPTASSPGVADPRVTWEALDIGDAGIPLVLPDLGWGTGDKVRGVAAIIRTSHQLRANIVQAEGYHANLLTRLARPLISRKTTLLGTLRGVPSPKQMRYERISHWACQRIITNAKHLKADLVTHGHVPERKIVHIPNGIRLDRFRYPHDPRWREKTAPGAHRVIVSLGRISLEKNMHWLAAAIGLLKRQGRLSPDVRVFIVGAAHHGEAQRLLDEAIRRDSLERIVLQHPATPFPMDYYHSADLTVLFSPAEGMPNVPIESLATGTPVLISSAANLEGIIEDGKSGWVVPTGEIHRLADKLATILALSDEQLAQMRTHCFDRAQQFSVQHMIAGYERFYEVVGTQ